MSQPLSALLAAGPDAPQPDRAQRLLIAQRLAEAVEAIHASGDVIGNLDAHRVLVAPDGRVTLGDDGAAAPEASGNAPAYTAPEIQGSLPGRMRPETQHDAFALAVLLFQLLMAGHHPYAGQWRGGGNLPDTPKAIQLGLYAYGGSAVTPPPGAPALSTLEPGLTELFARSFGATSAIFRNRPTAAAWAQALATAHQAEAATPPPAMTDRPSALPETEPGPSAHAATPRPVADAAPEAISQARPDTAPGATAPEAALPAQEPLPPGPASPPDQARQPRSGNSASPAKRTVPRRTALPRALPQDVPSVEPPHLFQAERPWSSVLGDHIGDLRRLAQPDGSWSATWRELRSEIEAWREVIAALIVFLLFLIVIVLAGGSDNWASPGARPAVVRATLVPATQTPLPRLTATRIAVNNPTVASFGSNFDLSDGILPSTGERFSASIRDKVLLLEVFGRGGRGKAMFNAAPAQGDFQFTVHVGETAGQGELLIYLREPDSGRTWVFAVDPGASTWGLYEERPSNNPLKVVIARHNYSTAIGRQPVRTISVTRQGERTRLLINGIAVNPQIARAMPRIDSPLKVGVGAMIPDEPDYADAPFIVRVDRVAMSADEE